MSDKKDDTYEEAATQLVDLEDFRKYMEEEEEEEQARQSEAPAPVASPSSNGASPQVAAPRPVQSAPSGGAVAPSPRTEQELPKVGPSNGKTCAILGILSLIPFVGILLGPIAMVVSLKEQKAIQQNQAPEAGRSLVNIGLYGGAIGLAISLVALAFTMVN